MIDAYRFPTSKSTQEVTADTLETWLDTLFFTQRQAAHALQAGFDVMVTMQEEQYELTSRLVAQILGTQSLWWTRTWSRAQSLSPAALLPDTWPPDAAEEAPPPAPAIPGGEIRIEVERRALPPKARHPAPAIGRDELVAAVMAAAPADLQTATRAVEALVDWIRTGLAQGEEIRLPGFGSFGVRETSPRRGRNPRTGEVISIPAGRRPVFRPGSQLRDAVS